MEKQRCPSIKTTRFLLFAFTISSSVVFLIFFSLWLTSATSSVHQETHFVFNRPTLTLGLKPLTAQNSTVSTRNFSGILIGTQFTRPGNRSGFATVPGFETKESGTEVSGDGEIANFAINGTSIGTRFGKSENSSGFAQGSVTGLVQGRGIESKGVSDNEIYKGASINGKLTSAQYGTFDNLPEKKQVSSGEVIEEHKIRNCDVTKGRWVFEENYALYTNVSCPFIDEGFDCQGNGRLDKEYMKWRWQPQDCDIPRFNATKMLELIRGKRLVYVGDSINRNQWESMLCLLMGAIKDPKRVYETRGRRITKEKGDYSFMFVDYKCTVEYYVTHFLVHESKARLGKKRVQTLRIDTMDKGSSRWRGADILVFNTAHWWTHFKTKAGINYYQERGQIHPHLDVSTALLRALLTWASWVDKHTNPGKTRVFFRSSAPSHFRGGQWNSGGHCKDATEPLPEISSFNYPEKNAIVEDVIKHMKTPVTFLNVTSLSEYRIDAHPSVFGRKFGKSYSSRFQDCSHWCLPGVPDTWNELLYYHLHFERREML